MGKHDTLRNQIVFGVVVAVAGLVAWRLFVLSFVRHTLYAATAQAQNGNIGNILLRGNIYIQDPKASDAADGRYLVATNKKFPDAYAVPTLIDDANVAAQKLAPIVKQDQSVLAGILDSKTSGSKVFARRLNDEQVSAITALGIKGIKIQYEMDRYYPNGSLLSNVLGFLGYTDQGRTGQYGIEGYLDDELSGRQTAAAPAAASDGGGGLSVIKSIFVSNKQAAAPRPADIVLTIDRNIQSFVENELASTLKKWNATGGTIIVQDPKTGKILAMADQPNFDPNNYSSSPTQNYLNRSTQEVFEPGSSFKPITMSMGLNLGKITPDTTYTDPGVIDIAGRQIHNFDNLAHGTVSMTSVLEKSLNTGAAFVENLVGQDQFLNYVINFGFGQKSGIDLPGEVNGDIGNLYSGRQVNFVTASFGQGIAVTPIQLIGAYSAIANGGKLMRPYLVDRIVYEGGTVETTKPEVVGIPISEKTSEQLRTMLVNVVDRGFDKARIKGYDIAGKTGTAQIPSPNGGYEPQGNFIHDFMGFAPASDPKFAILIKMDRPKGITFAADSLSPTFRDVAQYLINYYNIPPTRAQ